METIDDTPPMQSSWWAVRFDFLRSNCQELRGVLKKRMGVVVVDGWGEVSVDMSKFLKV